MANHEKFREVLFQASPCLGLLHFLLLFSYLLAKVADPEQSNSLWLTDWLTGEKGTLHLSFFFLQPLPSSYPSCPAGGMWLWHIAVPLHKCSRTHLYPQFPLPQQASTALSASVNWEDKVFLWPITPFAAVAAAGNGWLWQPADNALVSWFKSRIKQGWHWYPTVWTRAETGRRLSVLLSLIIFKGDGETYLIGKQKYMRLPLLNLPNPDGWSLGSFLEEYTEICVNWGWIQNLLLLLSVHK